MKQKKEMTCCIAVNALGENDFVGRKAFFTNWAFDLLWRLEKGDIAPRKYLTSSTNIAPVAIFSSPWQHCWDEHPTNPSNIGIDYHRFTSFPTQKIVGESNRLHLPSTKSIQNLHQKQEMNCIFSWMVPKFQLKPMKRFYIFKITKH